MLNENLDVGSAAVRVGYESASQFSREYSRLFGAPPQRDITRMRLNVNVVTSRTSHAGQVSNGAGFAPYWTKGGRELVYVVDTPVGATMMAVDVAVDGHALTLGKPQKLFEADLGTPLNGTWYDANADGSRFAVLLRSSQQATPKRTHVTLILNFFDEIRRATSGAAK